MTLRRAHQGLLHCYPASFRRRFSADLDRLFRERMARARERSAWHATLFVVWTCIDVIVCGVAERWRERHIPTTDRRPFIMWDTLRADTRSTLRLIRRSPQFAALAILVLALGLGANGAIFTAVDSILLRPLPYRASDRLVMLWSNNTNAGNDRNVVSPADFLDLRANNHTLEGVEALQSFLVPNEYRDGSDPVVVQSSTITTGMFTLLGRDALIGRTFREGDAQAVILSYGFWQRQYAEDRSVLGRRIQLPDGPATIIGVMPKDFVFPYRSMLGPSGFVRALTADVWLPMVFEGRFFRNPDGTIARQARFLGLVGRLRPEASIDQARADVATIAQQLALQYPAANRGWGATTVGLLDQTVGPIKPVLLLLLAGVGLVLLMACVNVANLLLARAVSRQRELAVRAALGASRARLVQQALIESVGLAACGGAGGALVLYAGVRAIVALAPPDTPRLAEITPHPLAFAFTFAMALLAGIAVGLLPAVSTSNTDVQSPLKDGGRGSTVSVAGRALRNRLVTSEITLAVILTAGSLLLLRSFFAVLQVDPGFQPHQLLTFQINIPRRLTTTPARNAFYDEFFSRLKHVPGVAYAGGTTRLPLGSTNVSTLLQIEGRQVEPAQLPEVEFRRALEDYFDAMSIPLLRGRVFSTTDTPDSPPVAIVNRELEARLFSGEDAIGRKLRFGTDATGPWSTIVGVVGSVHHASLEEAPKPEVYIAGRQGPPVSPFIVLRTIGAPALAASAVRAEVRAFDSSIPIYDLRAMTNIRGDAMSERRFVLVLVGLFGLIAVTLAAVGVYGVMALTVAERQSEMGVRLALGATPRGVLLLVLRQALRLAFIGLVVGLAAAVALMPLMAHYLFGVAAGDFITLATTGILLLAVSSIAALVPARKAMRVDPIVALRN